MATATRTKCRACAQNQAVKIGPETRGARKLTYVSRGMTTFGRRQHRLHGPTPGPRNLNENPARRAFGKNKVRPETRKQNADKHMRRNARVCKHAVSLNSLPESCSFIRSSFASLATFVPHSPTRDLQLTWTRWKALARHRHAQHTHTHTHTHTHCI